MTETLLYLKGEDNMKLNFAEKMLCVGVGMLAGAMCAKYLKAIKGGVR